MKRNAFTSKAKKFLALQSLFYAFANSIEALVPFLLAPILTRMLDPSGYGVWVLFVTYATFMRPVVGLTTQDAIRMRFYDFDQNKLEQFTHTALFVMVLLAIIVSAVTLLLGEMVAEAVKFPQGWLVSIVIAALLYEVFYTVLALQQFHNSRKAFLATQATQAILSMVFIVAFLLAGWDWRGVVIGRMLSMAIAIFFALRSLGFTLPKLLRIPERSFYRNIASFGVVYWPAGAVIMAVATTDKVAAAHYLGVEASAMYGVAALFASAFWMVNYSFVMAWTPWLFRKLKTAEQDGLREVASVSLAYFVLSAVAAAAFYVVAVLVAPVLLGEAFHSAIGLLPYTMLAIMLQGHFVHNLKFLHFDGRIELMSVLSAFTIGLNLWLSILWAKQMGISGIILATAVSFGAAFIMSGILILGRWMPLRKGARAVAG
jgi:O-antigen/teichoic acid export membrane protein